MPLTIDAGDPSVRARRGFGLTGRIPLALDESVTPVTIISDVSVPPYASEPRWCYGAAFSIATAAQLGLGTLWNNTGRVDQPSSVVAVVDKVIVSSADSLAARYGAILARRFTTAFVVPGTTVVGNDDQTGTGSLPQNARLQLFQDPSAANPVGITIWALEFNGQARTVDMRGVVLYPGDALSVFGQSAAGAAQNHNFAFQWREFTLRAS